MGRLQIKMAGHEYREYDWLLIEQVIGGLNNEGPINEILTEVTTKENIEEATSECILSQVCRVQVQRAHRSALNSINEAKDFEAIWQNTKKHTHETSHNDKCKYCWTGQCSSSNLHMERNQGCVEKTAALRQLADCCRDNRKTSGPKRCWTRYTRRKILAW